MYKCWLMKCLFQFFFFFFFSFSLEFPWIKESANEQAKNVVLPKITEEGIPSNSWLLGRLTEDKILNQPWMVQCRPDALTKCIRSCCSWAEKSTLPARHEHCAGTSYCSFSLCATLHCMWKVCLKPHRVHPGDHRSGNCIQQQPTSVAGRAHDHHTDNIALSSLETWPSSRKEWEIHRMEKNFKA